MLRLPRFRSLISSRKESEFNIKVQGETQMSLKLKLMFIVSLFAACALVAVPAIAQGKPGPPTQNVLVVNGAGQPVPTAAQGTTNVAGTVNVGNTPSVNVANTPAVSISGTPAVSLAGTPGVTVANTAAQPVPTATAGASLATHMGQLPSEHVILQSFGTRNCPSSSWVRIDPSGNPSLFTIPNGKNLVITDADLSAFFTGNSPGYYSAVGLELGAGASSVLDSFVLADPSGTLATQQHLTSGIVVSVLPNCFGGSSNSTVIQAVIRGYLIPAS
jgi:hypothetical protein